MKRPLATVLLLLPGVATAMDLVPDEAALVRAVAEGAATGRQSNGYDAREYLVYTVDDARDIRPGQGSVDAVLLLTPLERLRHLAYLRATTGVEDEPTAEAAKLLFVPNEIGFRVFAHGVDGADSQFTERFSSGRLRLGSTSVNSSRVERSPASVGRYPLAASDRERTVGTVTYWFRLDVLPGITAGTATLEFLDAENHAMALPVDFSTRR